MLGSVLGGNLLSGGVMGIARGFANLAKFAVSAGVKMEQTRISYQTMVGDVEKGNKLFAETAEFANVTPFSTEGVQKAGRTLLAFGVQAEGIIPTLGVLGDISAGTGKDLSELGVIYGQIKGAGRLMGQDLLQLINAGFNPLQQISKRTGESMGDLKDRMSKGAIGFSEVQQAFQDATTEGGLFYQMSEKQSKTLGGLWSTLSGKMQNSIGLFMESSSGFFKSIVAGGLEAFEWFSSMGSRLAVVFEPITTLISEVSAEFSELFGGMGEGITVTSVLEGAFNLIGNAIRFFMPAIKASVSLFMDLVKAAKEVYESISTLGDRFPWIKKMMKGFYSGMVAGFVWIKTVVSKVLGGVSDLIVGIFTFDTDRIQKGLTGLANKFDGAGTAAAAAFNESYSTESQDFFAGGDDKKPKTTTTGPTKTFSDLINPTGDSTKTTKGGAGAKGAKSSSVSGVSSGRPTSINISIGKLIETFTVETTNLQSMESQVKRAVSRALVSAVNDVNLVAQ